MTGNERSCFINLFQLFPLLLRGLELPDLNLRSNITESLVAIIEGEGVGKGIEAVTSHLGALVSRLLRNTRVDRHAKASVVKFTPSSTSDTAGSPK